LSPSIVYQASLFGQFLAGSPSAYKPLYVVMVIVFLLLLLFGFDKLVQLLTPRVTERVDDITTSYNVTRIRRAETFVGLILPVFRLFFIIAAIFLIWHIASPSDGPIGLIGVGTLIIIFSSATIVPLLRDVTFGFIMMAERWYNVGDHVVFEPFTTSGGVVERVTLRSTKIRRLNGEAMWIHHQNIQGVHVSSAVSHPQVIETFVNDPVAGQKIIEDAIKIIPTGATTTPEPLTITEVKQVADKIWRITAVCEVTPFREWVVEDFAIKVIHKTDKLTGKDPVIVHGPVAFYADSTAERRFRRSTHVRHRVRTPKTKATKKR
jgi:hypothetical protein